jgi:non-heme chloroperoxidase
VEDLLRSVEGRGLVVFVHGLWTHAVSWLPWIDLFSRNGYDCVNVSWPGEAETVAACRATPRSAAGIDAHQVSRHIGDLTRRLGRIPIVVGGDAGAAFTEILLDDHRAAAAIAIAPVHARSAVAAAVRGWPPPSALIRPNHPLMPSRPQFHRAVANAVNRAESDRLHAQYVVPGAGKTLLGLRRAVRAGGIRPADGPGHRRVGRRGPLLFVSGGRDVSAPEAGVSAMHGRHRRRSPDATTDYHVFPDRGHSMVVDSGWREVAYFCLDWLTAQNL